MVANHEAREASIAKEEGCVAPIDNRQACMASIMWYVLMRYSVDLLPKIPVKYETA